MSVNRFLYAETSVSDRFHAGSKLTPSLSAVHGNVVGTLAGAWSDLISGIGPHVMPCELTLEANLSAFYPMLRVTVKIEDRLNPGGTANHGLPVKLEA